MPIIIGQENGQKHAVTLPSQTATRRVALRLINQLRFTEIAPSELVKMADKQFTIIK